MNKSIETLILNLGTRWCVWSNSGSSYLTHEKEPRRILNRRLSGTQGQSIPF